MTKKRSAASKPTSRETTGKTTKVTAKETAKTGAKAASKKRAKGAAPKTSAARPRKPRRKSDAELYIERLAELRSKITAASQVTERDQHLRDILDAARRCPESLDVRGRAAELLLEARAGLRRGERRAALVFKAAQLDIDSVRVVLAEAPQEPEPEEDGALEASEPESEEAEPARAVA